MGQAIAKVSGVRTSYIFSGTDNNDHIGDQITIHIDRVFGIDSMN